MRRLLRAGGLAAVLLAGTTPAFADPALWRIADADSQVWLFGSIHFLEAGREWRTPEFETALAAADIVYFEILLAQAQPLAGRLLLELGGHRDGRQLSDYLDGEDQRKWDAAVADMKIDAVRFERMRPWLAALSLPQPDGPRLNFAGGVESLLQAEVTDERERAFETMEGQLRALADMSDAGQVDLLMRALDAPAATQADVDALTSAWITGNVEAVADLLADQIGSPGTELYDRLIVERNTRWAEEIVDILATGDDALVVVGAGHFAGPASLPSLLRARGIAVERLQ